MDITHERFDFVFKKLSLSTKSDFLPALNNTLLAVILLWLMVGNFTLHLFSSLFVGTHQPPPTNLPSSPTMNECKQSLFENLLSIFNWNNPITKNFLYEETVWTAHSSFKNLYFSISRMGFPQAVWFALKSNFQILLHYHTQNILFGFKWEL